MFNLLTIAGLGGGKERLQCYTIQYDTIQYDTILRCNVMQCNSIRYVKMQCVSVRMFDYFLGLAYVGREIFL